MHVRRPDSVPVLDPIAALRAVCAASFALAVLCVLGSAGCGEAPAAGGCEGDACAVADACDPVDWQCSEAESYTPASMGGQIHLATAPDGSLGVTFFDSEAGALVLGRGAPGQPLRTIRLDDVNATAPPTGPSALAFGADGVLHVLYAGRGGSSVVYARVEGVRVVERTVVEELDAPMLGPSIAAGESTVHAVYYDASQAHLRHAERAAEAWSTSTIPPHNCPDPCASPPDRGRFSSMGLIADQPVVAYYDRTAGDLVLARRQGDKWSQFVLDGTDPSTGADTGDVGRWPSLHIGPAGTVAVAYQDTTRGALRYASSPGGELRIEVVDDGTRADPVHGARWDGIVGAYASLVTTANGNPAIYYFDATDAAVRRVVRKSTGWDTPTVVSTGAAGLWVNAAKTSDGVEVACSEGWEPSSDGKGMERRLRWWRP